VLRGLAGILDQLATLRARVVAPETAPLEIVRIGVIDSVSATWMPHFVESLQARFPGLGIDLSVASTESLMQDMRADELDLIFAVDPLIAEECRSFVSCVLEMSWVAAPRLIAPGTIYPVDALAQMQIVSFQKGSPPYRMIAPYFQDENVLASKLITSNSLYAIVNLVIDGFGISAIPTVSITRELAAGLLAVIPVEKRFPPLPIICTYRASRSAGHMREVIEQARISAARFCAAAPAGTAWID
jgi:DNA-binding transcriptional LysR family regulator